MTQPVRVVLIGNSFARRVQLPSLHWASENGSPNEVIGIAGANEAKARETAREWKIPCATNDYRGLLELEPDLVIITTPVDLHAPMVLDSLRTSAAVLCDKPFTLNAREASELCTKARGRLAVLHHQLRWSPQRQKLREMVQSGECIGTPRLCRVELGLGGLGYAAKPYGWWFQRERGGGILGAIGSHLIDGLRHILGEVDSARCDLSTFVTERPDLEGARHPVTADEHAEVWLRMKSGVRVSLSTSILTPHARPSVFEVVGDRGTLRLEGEEQLFGGEHGGDFSPIDVEELPPTDERLVRPFDRQDPFFLRDLLRTVAAGETEMPGAATFDDGLAVMHVLDAARRSNLSARWEPAGSSAS